MFWMSSRGGTTYLRNVYNYYVNDVLQDDPSNRTESHELAKINRKLKHVLFIRNPYGRLFSAFVYIYIICKTDTRFGDDLTFELFVENLDDDFYDNDYHLLPQTFLHESASMFKGLEFDMIMDISNINYDYLNKIFNKVLPETHKGFINSIQGVSADKDNFDDKYKMTKVEIENLFGRGISLNYIDFYNEELICKCSEMYKGDFELFSKFGFNYSI